jgi:hypothetical protein
MIFRKVLSILCFFFLLTLAVRTSAQSTNAVVTDVTFGLLTWVKHLNNDIDKPRSTEKATQLKEQLGSLKESLTLYRRNRKMLSDSLFRNNIAPGKKDENNLEALKTRMSSVMQGMREVNDLVNESVQVEGDKLNDQIYKTLYEEQGHYLSYLEAFLDGKEVTKKDLALDGSVCYTRLEECINLITTMEVRVLKK